MSSTLVTNVEPTATLEPTSTVAPTIEPVRRTLSVLGGLLLAAAPLLIMAGNATSPPQASNSAADYIASLARDPLLTHTSATFYHYGWIAMGLGILAAIGLVRGKKGARITLIGGLGAALGAFQISGILLLDWFLSSMGNTISSADAVTVFTTVQSSLSVTIWLNSAKIGVVILPVLFYVGLARAGVISWKLAPLALLPMVVGPMIAGLIPGTLGTVANYVISLVGFLPTFVTAARLIGRSRLTQKS